ncbi:hypothetical protein X971_3355 [Agrobacterium tumefaciens LBA4213 (Ach5)]|nr:hypothetical protein X971_3355 [Agrobacterium tumefaciens LBA4213 (Ach5)]
MPDVGGDGDNRFWHGGSGGESSKICATASGPSQACVSSSERNICG